MSLTSRIRRPAYPYLPYNYRHKLIFIHVPKCGGTSILTELNQGVPLWVATASPDSRVAESAW